MDTRIQRALDLINTNYQCPMSVADLAAAMAISSSRFCHMFRGEVGTTPGRYLRRVRMLAAETLLSESNLPIKEIFSRCGFSDKRHFARRFKSIHGVSPSQYRNKTSVKTKNASLCGQ